MFIVLIVMARGKLIVTNATALDTKHVFRVGAMARNNVVHVGEKAMRNALDAEDVELTFGVIYAHIATAQAMKNAMHAVGVDKSIALSVQD